MHFYQRNNSSAIPTAWLLPHDTHDSCCPVCLFHRLIASLSATVSQHSSVCNFLLEALKCQERSRARARQAYQTSRRSIHKRRGGWNPKPRHGSWEPEDSGTAKEWYHNSSKTCWWDLFDDDQTYVPNTFAAHEFYDEFRMSRQMFEELYNELLPKFKDKVPGDGLKGRRSQPLRLKLGALIVMLTEGLSYKRAARVACIDKVTVRKFFVPALRWLIQQEYAKHVYTPRSAEEALAAERKFAKCGFPGGITAFDGVHVRWRRCPFSLQPYCVGKEGHPTLVWNVAVSLNKEVMHVEGAHWGARNDKTMGRLDNFIQLLRSGTDPILSTGVYHLYNATGQLVRHMGYYALVDGGYHRWKCLITPDPNASSPMARKCAKRFESVRKAPECTFGILKKRFEILETGFRFKKADTCNLIFKVCCMLHNRILRERGFHLQGDLDEHWDKADVQMDQDRINSQAAAGSVPVGVPRPVDNSLVGNDVAVQYDNEFFVKRQQLLTHYAVSYEKCEIMWPKKCHLLFGRHRLADKRPKESGS